MKLNNKGFAVSGILYSLLVLFLILLLAVLGVLASGKFAFDKMKDDIIADLTNKSKAFIYVSCDNYNVKQGYNFDLLTGVKFVNESGNVITQTITNTSSPVFNYNTAGTYTITYSSTYNSIVFQATRTIVVVNGLSSNYVCNS